MFSGLAYHEVSSDIAVGDEVQSLGLVHPTKAHGLVLLDRLHYISVI